MSESALCLLMADSPYKVQGLVIALPEFLFCGHSMNIYWWRRKWSSCRLAVTVFECRLCLPSAYVEPVSQSHSVVSDSVTPWTAVHGVLQARILKWVAFPFSMGPSQPRDQTQVSRIAGRFFSSWATREDLRTCWWLQNQPPCVCWLGKIAPSQDRKNITHGL